MSYMMRHPDHGFNNLYTPEEVEESFKHGWVVHMNHPNPAFKRFNAEFTAEEVVEPMKRLGWETNDKVEATPEFVPDELIPEPVSLDIYEQYKAKFGKLPHHRMKASTIEAALKE